MDTDDISSDLGLGKEVHQDSPGVAEDVTPADSGETQQLSKRAMKKLRKRQEWLDSKPERRKKEKEKRRLKMATRKENKEYEESRTASRKSLKEVKMSGSSCLVRVVFDMQFGDLMTERDLGKCLKQITRCYRLVVIFIKNSFMSVPALIDKALNIIGRRKKTYML